MNKSNLSLPDYKKWKLNAIFKPYFTNSSRYYQMKGSIANLEDAEKWSGY